MLERRRFLHRAVGAACSLGLFPAIVPRRVFGAAAPSNRIGVGVIGCGNQSEGDVKHFLDNDDVQVVAVCDVNRGSHGYRDASQFLGREPVRQRVERFYADKLGNNAYRGCGAYVDFREVLARDDVDAVVLIVPDHWHAIMTELACEAGKDVYCEKPLTLTIDDGKRMIRAVRRHGRILQTGSQWRSNPEARRVCELVRSGRVGKLRKIVTYLVPNNKTGPGPGWQPMPVPEGLDYPMWLGPAPDAPYHEDRCLYRFRFILGRAAPDRSSGRRSSSPARPSSRG